MLSPAVKTRSTGTRPTSSSSSASIGSSVPDAGAGGGRRTPSGHGPSSRSSSGATDRGDRDSAVRVVVRVRPQSKKEIESGGTDCVTFTSEDTIEINGAKKTYDRVFTPKATQREVFDYVAKPLVAELFNGYNGTIFAYGQTSSGKTHTMEGPSIHDPELAGVIPRTVREIFLSVAQAPESVEFIIKVSYIEIYMEKIRDLLDTYHKKVNLPVREDKQRGVYVAGATEEYVTSADELISVMATGAKNRVVAATGMNQGSSRSHSVFIISLQQRDTNDSSTKTGMLYLVDLAGSEMVKKTHATGQVLEEAKTINKSLSALGQVINALTDDKKPHVPYRDSKLTRVLQNSLGGNSKTCLIVNCSPSSFNEAETQSTLRFGSRAKRIQNKAVVNETRSVEELSALLGKAEATLELQQTYIAALEKQLKASKNGKGGVSQPPPAPSGGPAADGGDNGGTSPSTTQDAEAATAIRRLTERNHALLAELEEEKAEVKRSRQEVNELRGVLQERDVQLEEAAAMLSDTKKRHAVRQEGLVAEKADVVGELEAMRNRLQEVMQAHEFENKERSLTIEKLQGENARLADELRELTGDAVEKAPASNSLQPPARQSRPATSPTSEVDEAESARAAAGSETKEKRSEVRQKVEVTRAAETEGWKGGEKPAQGDDASTKGEGVLGEESKLKQESSEKAAGDIPAATGEAAVSTEAAAETAEAVAAAAEKVVAVAAETPSETEAAVASTAAAPQKALGGADKGGAGENENENMNVTDNEKGSNESAPTESGPDEWDPAALERWGRAALLAFLLLYVVGCVGVLVYVLGAISSVLWTLCVSVASCLRAAFALDPELILEEEQAGWVLETTAAQFEEAFCQLVPMDSDGKMCGVPEDDGGESVPILIGFMQALFTLVEWIMRVPSGVLSRLYSVINGVLAGASAGTDVDRFGPEAVDTGAVDASAPDDHLWGGLRDGLESIVVSAFSVSPHDTELNAHGIIFGLVFVYVLAITAWRCISAQIARGIAGIMACIYRRSIPAPLGRNSQHEAEVDSDPSNLHCPGEGSDFELWLRAAMDPPIWTTLSDCWADGHSWDFMDDDDGHDLTRGDSSHAYGASLWPIHDYLGHGNRQVHHDPDVVRGSASASTGLSHSAWPWFESRQADDTDGWSPTGEAGSAGATEDVLAMVRAREQAWRVWQTSTVQETKCLRERAVGDRERFNRTRQELDKRLADNEQHREQLVQDLHKEEQRVIELERAAEGKGDGLAERERRHQVDIQKRLEQLVAVHRQLLRRYGGLELENSEYRKKIHLRNERMAQLQRNTELLSMTMKEQAERHVAELSSLREQVSSLHEQQQQRRERAVMYPPPYHRERRRIIRGGGADNQVHEVKIIHGGSRRFSPEDMPWGGIGPRESSVGSLTTSPVRPGRGSNGSGIEAETPSTPRNATAGLWSTGESLLERLATAALPSRGRSPSTSK